MKVTVQGGKLCKVKDQDMRQTVKMGKVRPAGAFAALHAGKWFRSA